jgi:hypothetical protein
MAFVQFETATVRERHTVVERTQTRGTSMPQQRQRDLVSRYMPPLALVSQDGLTTPGVAAMRRDAATTYLAPRAERGGGNASASGNDDIGAAASLSWSGAQQRRAPAAAAPRPAPYATTPLPSRPVPYATVPPPALLPAVDAARARQQLYAGGSGDGDDESPAVRGGGGPAAAAPQPAVAEPARRLGRCTICSSEQFHLKMMHDRTLSVAAHGDKRARAAVVRRVTDFTTQIFELERTLSLTQTDDVVFRAMLDARRLFVEDVLERHRLPYERWSMDALRRHYAPRGGCHFDLERTLQSRLDAMTDLHELVERRTLVSIDADGNEKVDQKAVDSLVKIDARIEKLAYAVADAKRRRIAVDGAGENARALVSALADAQQVALGGRVALDAAHAARTMHSVGSF